MNGKTGIGIEGPLLPREVSAGGVVFLGTNVLVVRTRRGEWVFPKGKLEAGESLTDCALREVWEETGVSARILSKLGETHYTYTSEFTGEVIDKTVHWFLMEAKSPGVTLNIEEGILEGEFMSPDAAMRLLTFDRHLLDEALRLIKASQNDA